MQYIINENKIPVKHLTELDFHDFNYNLSPTNMPSTSTHNSLHTPEHHHIPQSPSNHVKTVYQFDF